MVERLISAKTRENEEEIEQTLRPRRLAEYIGQEKMKESILIMLEAAKAREAAELELKIAARLEHASQTPSPVRLRSRWRRIAGQERFQQVDLR